ncbi:SDR family NAD(P)-dependent oxidoreductase [Prevotella communis]|uniref:SDR family NAD(P)-dependent oxidoreductase n=1 Tax=Prevotella communis TaxID=2913614 RepID=UPI001EDBB5F4|nr:SDR family NAD(P)-dependent oxidoreductase [Prevotella communis]UKK63511.1 SDR family NAD(P)-dependent oxidoreductase [Prevotella communis]UKK66337.1 SDR family NAD(P)-dependent oxidoreductase [Prevotella communis]
MKRILVVGGANGIGLSIATELSKRTEVERIYIVDKAPLLEEFNHPKFESFQFDLTNEDYSFFERFTDINALMITAGFGKLALFKDVQESYIVNSFNVNTIPVLRLVHKFYGKLEAHENFYCGVMVSIAGFMSSPFFAVYGATKAALKIFIESVNVELKKSGATNCVLNVSPGSLKGTSFTAGKTDLSVTAPMANAIIERLEAKKDLFIPQYEEIFKGVLERYHLDFRAEGMHSYEYKIKSGRMNKQ